MSSIKLDFDSFKSSGVYTLEYDNTVQEINEADSFRIAVGFTEHGPFNRPVFLNGPSDRRKVFGNNINTKLEKRGSFFDRSLDVLLSAEPTIALNLLKVDEKDKVGFATFGLSSNDVKTHSTIEEKYDDEVFCVEVEKYNTLLVKGGKSEFWCGNCRCVAIPVVPENLTKKDR